MRIRHTRTAALIAGVAMAVCMLFVSVRPALADDSTVVLDYRPTRNAVADRTVHIQVNKLDRDTHEFVVGAHLQIIDKETNQVMADWVSDGTTQNSARELDIDRTYILHEVEAPEGYEPADDVEFILRSVNFETKGEVLSGAKTADGEANAEFSNVAGDIETQAFVISLYDEASDAISERVERRQRTANTEDNKKTTNSKSEARKGSGNLTKTGDSTSYLPIILVAIVGAGLLAFGFSRRRK